MALTVHGGFEWDTKTAAGNLAIYGLSFVEAATVFGSVDAVYYTNGTENLVTGTSVSGAVITVAYAWFPRAWAPGIAGRCRIYRASPATLPERQKLRG